ncbi:hypothetical protein LH67_21290 [Xenorhabdus nematophila]|nr:hypothetical protein LH67_21290 [Xenorhabdus nematophila]
MLLMIIDYLLMRCSGFYGQAHPGEIYRPIMATGKIRIAVFAGGGTKAYGKDCLKNASLNPISNG